MTPSRPTYHDAELRRLSRVKQVVVAQTPALGQEMIAFFKQSVAKRQTNLGKISERWVAIVPDSLTAHCALDSLHRGTLTVLIDSSSHLYMLKQLLLAGLEQQLLINCKGQGLRKISLKPGVMKTNERRN